MGKEESFVFAFSQLYFSLADDATRVLLQEGPDYINASYVSVRVYVVLCLTLVMSV